jgi:hypothetical protein
LYHRNKNKKLYIMKIIKWIKKHLWWRFYYIKTRITTQEANRGRCLICHAGIRVNSNDKSQPICPDYGCPCKWNEILICKDDLFRL